MKYVIFEKAKVQVRPTLTRRGPRRGFQREDPRTRQRLATSSMYVGEANPEEFVEMRNRIPTVKQEYFTPYTAEEIRQNGIKTFLTSNKNAGVAVKSDGDIVNLFSLEKGIGKYVLLHAMANGGRKLDCFDKREGQEKGLPDYYKAFGFIEVKREKNWTEGEPDVIYMELQSEMSKSIHRRSGMKDKTKEQWRLHLMKKFTAKDYTKMEQALLEMMGSAPTKEELVQARKGR